MPRIEVPFADGFYVSESGPLLTKRAVNVYPSIPEQSAASPKVLFHRPGIVQVASVTGGNSRGAIEFSDGTIYRVVGNALYSIDINNTTTNLGAIGGTSDVSMDSNGINIAIVDPTGKSYFFTPDSGVLEEVTSAAFLSFGQATSVTFKDGFYVYTTDAIFFSSSAKTVNDGKDFNALDFADAEISPDLIVSGINDHNQLYIGGKDTTEVYRTRVTSGFPFQRIPGAMIPKGFSARGAVISFDNSFLFLGGGKNQKPAIYKALGSSTIRISTKAIERVIHSYSDEVVSQARAFSYAEGGDYFAVFTVGDNTFVYDETTSVLQQRPSWHERQTGVTNGTGFKKWRSIHGIKAFGNIQVGDDRSGLIGNLDNDVFKEYGETIEKFWTTMPFINKGDKIFSKEVELFMQTGLGNADVADPQIRMDYSDNGSRTFGSEITKSLGKVGEYKLRLRYKRMGGIPLTRVLRWKCTDPVPINAYSLFANAESVSRG